MWLVFGLDVRHTEELSRSFRSFFIAHDHDPWLCNLLTLAKYFQVDSYCARRDARVCQMPAEWIGEQFTQVVKTIFDMSRYIHVERSQFGDFPLERIAGRGQGKSSNALGVSLALGRGFIRTVSRVRKISGNC